MAINFFSRLVLFFLFFGGVGFSPSLAQEETSRMRNSFPEPDSELITSLAKVVKTPLSREQKILILKAEQDREKKIDKEYAEYRFHLTTISGLPLELIKDMDWEMDLSSSKLNSRLMEQIEYRLGRFLSPQEIQETKRLDAVTRRILIEIENQFTGELQKISGLTTAAIDLILQE